MLIVYGSLLCKDCNIFKQNLDANKIPYLFIDINESMRNLKEFLFYRDKLPLFDLIKNEKRVGIPFLKDGDIFSLDWESYLRSCGINNIIYIEEKTCSFNGNGC